ncbi:MAG: DUF2141 domain-containing protein [Sediminicola sp.]
MYAIKYLFLLIPCWAICQNTLSIEVKGADSDQGKIHVALYKDAKGFLKFDKYFRNGSIAADSSYHTFRWSDLPNGRYAIAIFHDTNDNEKLDTNWLGIPKEAVAFSKGRMKTFGPPNFEECAFNVLGDTTVQIAFP